MTYPSPNHKLPAPSSQPPFIKLKQQHLYINTYINTPKHSKKSSIACRHTDPIYPLQALPSTQQTNNTLAPKYPSIPHAPLPPSHSKKWRIKRKITDTSSQSSKIDREYKKKKGTGTRGGGHLIPGKARRERVRYHKLSIPLCRITSSLGAIKKRNATATPRHFCSSSRLVCVCVCARMCVYLPIVTLHPFFRFPILLESKTSFTRL